MPFRETAVLHFIAALAVLVVAAAAGLIAITMWVDEPEYLRQMDRHDWLQFIVIAVVAGGTGAVLHTLLNLFLGRL
jgi:hypothetical protein